MSDREIVGRAKPLPDQPQAVSWESHYGKRNLATGGRYPTEWVVRTLAGGNYPHLKLDKSQYRGARILDMGCGDGRNLQLLLDLGFDVHACEVSPGIVSTLKQFAQNVGWPVHFEVGANALLPYPDRHFDYMLCCASCYYLDGSTTWPEVREELARTVRPGGLLVANFPDGDNFILDGAVCQSDGSLLITADPYGLRNGVRFVVARNAADLDRLLSPHFRTLGVAHQDDDYFGLCVSGYIAVAQRT